MTKQELNRDIKKLWLRYKKEYLNREPDQFWTEKIAAEREKIYSEMKTELRRLYNADPEKTSTTPINTLRLVRINQTLVVIPLHHLATNWKLD